MRFSSPHPEITIPDAVSFPEFVFSNFSQFTDKPALLDSSSGRSYSFGEFEQTTLSFARGLHRRGFAKGDVLAIYCPNLPSTR